jgi:uncharacterized membrane protein YdjX (TVP38/TMEM64 family)
MDSTSKKIINKTLILRGLVVLAIVIAFIAYFTTGLNEILTFEYLKEQRESLIALVNDNLVLSIIVYSIAYILIVAFSLPGAAIMTLGGGMVFGMSAVFMILFSATTGATLAFWAARFLLGQSIQKRFAKQLATLNKQIEENGPNYLFSLRLFPFFPFWLLNLLSGLTTISTTKYIIATGIGIIPGTIAFVYTGTQLGNIDELREIISPGVLSAFVVVALVSFLPGLIKKELDKRK